ncbi:glutamate-cysteine ligase family protein, partial [Pseudomonas aeruginosa]|uniref:glutamate-cysteine ligase family protein n=1 Tax=Pseudomonas aeruginosa TaxID=287 RepID=UPI002226DE13
MPPGCGCASWSGGRSAASPLRAGAAPAAPACGWRRGARAPRRAPSPRLFEDQGRVARRSLVCGLHVHVEIPPSHDRMAVLQR